ncbi:MAG: outer membrane beta-barrel protein [Bacteroidales bacterium]|nr:outer membrane beta-barrel protein [Bacteroidales bacterium]
MSNKWTDKLPGLMEGFTEAEPEGLWDAVQAGMPAPKRRVAAVWWISGAAALAAAAAIAAIVLLRPSTPDVPVVAPVIVADSGDDELIVSAPEELAPRTVPSRERIVPAQEIPVETEELETVDESEPIIGNTELIIDTVEPVTDTTEPVTDTTEPVTDTIEEPVPPSVIDTPSLNTRPADKPVRHLPKLNPRVHVLFALSSPGQSVSATTNGIGIPSNPGFIQGMMDTKATGTGSSVNLSMLGRNKASTTDAFHSQTARLALGLKVDLNERWGIQTGVVSSTLESRFNSTAGSLQSITSRTMKYLGIPLFGCYNVFELGKLGMCLNAGPMYEFSTSTRTDTESFAGGHRTGKESDYDLLDDRKWSMNAGAAFQYRVRPHGALYVQPGVSYYFKDKSPLETVYTEHPAQFNLTFGYKFEF